MLDSIKSINLVSAYTANGFKKDRDLSEVKDLFKANMINEDIKNDKTVKKKTDILEISSEALKLLNSKN